MARRTEIKGICNSLVDSFTSRYNDLDGYWALGKFQSFLQSNSGNELCFELIKRSDDAKTYPFSQTSSYYSGALHRHLGERSMPIGGAAKGTIILRAASPTAIECCVEIVTDLGRTFRSKRTVIARPHDPMRELRSAGEHGPRNQKGTQSGE